jgi:hypothetical protein
LAYGYSDFSVSKASKQKMMLEKYEKEGKRAKP